MHNLIKESVFTFCLEYAHKHHNSHKAKKQYHFILALQPALKALMIFSTITKRQFQLNCIDNDPFF